MVDERIEQQIEVLMDHPEFGRPGRVNDIRELVISKTPYLVAYRILGDGGDSAGLFTHRGRNSRCVARGFLIDAGEQRKESSALLELFIYFSNLGKALHQYLLPNLVVFIRELRSQLCHGVRVGL